MNAKSKGLTYGKYVAGASFFPFLTAFSFILAFIHPLHPCHTQLLSIIFFSKNRSGEVSIIEAKIGLIVAQELSTVLS